MEKLSPKAQELLSEAIKGGGQIWIVKAAGEPDGYKANGKTYGMSDNPNYADALNELFNAGFIRPDGTRLFNITNKGRLFGAR